MMELVQEKLLNNKGCNNELHGNSYIITTNVKERNITAEDSLLERLLDAENIISQSVDHLALQDNNLLLQVIAWREKIAQWFYDVVDHVNKPRSVVYAAMNILDRYSAVKLQNENFVVGQTYRIAAMTAIFLAIRITGVGDLPITDLIQASRGNFGVQDVIATGKCIVGCLTWGIRLVTPHDFVDAMLQFLSSRVPKTIKTSLWESASYLVELSVYDSYFTRISASKIAMAATLNSTEKIAVDDELTNIELSAFFDALSQVTRTRVASADMISIKLRLNTLRNRIEIEDSDEKSIHYISDYEYDCGIPTYEGYMNREKQGDRRNHRIKTSLSPVSIDCKGLTKRPKGGKFC